MGINSVLTKVLFIFGVKVTNLLNFASTAFALYFVLTGRQTKPVDCILNLSNLPSVTVLSSLKFTSMLLERGVIRMILNISWLV